MESSIGALKILIEADASGLTSQLKKASSSITSFVGSMNKQEVNWTQILSRTISPAIISGIAATFALALTQSMSFANQLTQTANTSTEAFGENSVAATKSALAIQAVTGQSANSVAEAMGLATRALGKYASGEALVSEASKFALVTGIPLLDLVKELIPVMQQWGITDAEKIKMTIEDLFGAADQGKVSIMDLIQTMGDTGAMLKGKTSIEEASAALEAFSNQSGNTSASAISVFGQVSKAAFGDIQEQAKLSALGVGNIQKAVEDGGMTKALADLEKSFGKLGTASQIILASNAGFDSTTTANLISASKSYASMAIDSKTILDNESILGKKIEENLSPTNKLQVAWGSLKSTLTELINKTGLIDALSDSMSYLSDLIKNPKETLKETAKGFSVMDLFTGVGVGAVDIFSVLGKMFGKDQGNNTSNSQSNTYNYNNYINSNVAGSPNTPSSNLDYAKTHGY